MATLMAPWRLGWEPAGRNCTDAGGMKAFSRKQAGGLKQAA